jgi:predicted metal-dependent HD superfamily phosphohydrolase
MESLFAPLCPRREGTEALPMERADMHPSLHDRFIELTARVGRPAPVVFPSLVSAYQQPERPYHNLDHIRACLDEFDDVRQSCRDRDAIEAAIWFHDAIYDPLRGDNEQKSAEFARRLLARCGVSSAFCDRVEELILVTRHDRVPADPDAQLLADIDLSILGKPWQIFDDYERAIRGEYAYVIDADFRAGRAKVLQRFLDRERIYSTEVFHARYEAAARENLQRSVARLREVSPA